jgi:hypothetical protein
VEFECVVTQDVARAALFPVLCGQGYSWHGLTAHRDHIDLGWEIKGDCTVSAQCTCGDYYHCSCLLGGKGREIVTPPLSFAAFHEVEEVLAALRDAGTVTNHTCGGHVHVDAEGMTEPALKTLARLAHAWGDHLYTALDVWDNRREYCEEMIADDLLRVSSIRRARGYGRYWGLNMVEALDDHNTVEFRLFNGTVDTLEVRRNVLLAVGMVDYAKRNQFTGIEIRPQIGEPEREAMARLLDAIGMTDEAFPEERASLLANSPANRALTYA